MEKNSRVEAGVTPSVLSGRKSDFVKNGNAFAEGEKPVSEKALDSLAKAKGLAHTGR